MMSEITTVAAFLLDLQYGLLMLMIYGTGPAGTVIFKTNCFCGSGIDRLGLTYVYIKLGNGIFGVCKS